MDTFYHIYPLSEQALTIEVATAINEVNRQKVISLNYFLQQLYIPGLLELVPAYGSVTLYYDLQKVIQQVPESHSGVLIWMKKYLETELQSWQATLPLNKNSSLIEIPVCYDEEYGLDLKEVADQLQLTKKEVIQLHCAEEYKVFMMGFVPGFAYMGTLPNALNMARKSIPNVKVPAGSVAIAGLQTGIYPIESPGGWHILGRTPLKLFDKNREHPFLLKPGDTVKFYPISKLKFQQWGL
jgi:inhibitor of KinA